MKRGIVKSIAAGLLVSLVTTGAIAESSEEKSQRDTVFIGTRVAAEACGENIVEYDGPYANGLCEVKAGTETAHISVESYGNLEGPPKNAYAFTVVVQVPPKI